MTKLTIDQIARVAHEVNRSYVQGLLDANPAPVVHSALGGSRVRPPILAPLAWEEVSQAQRDSVLDGVRFALYNPNAAPGDQHRNWCILKRAAGWIYGEVKDEVRQTHPDLGPFETLPAAEQAKDSIFRAIVKQLAQLEIVSDEGPQRAHLDFDAGLRERLVSKEDVSPEVRELADSIEFQVGEKK